ncbi:MAG: VOC family protein [Bacteroidota bacterium]|nr:VOC family protein [Bacteroidota bacterium]
MKNLVKHMYFIALILSFHAYAQKPVLNHIAVYVQNLEKSTTFYRQVIQLDTIPEPFHDGRHSWFSISGACSLHIISGATSIINHDKNSHLCFSVSSLTPFVDRLRKYNIPFEDWPGTPQSITSRPDGVKQIYFKDPDGWWIEINDAK